MTTSELTTKANISQNCKWTYTANLKAFLPPPITHLVRFDRNPDQGKTELNAKLQQCGQPSDLRFQHFKNEQKEGKTHVYYLTASPLNPFRAEVIILIVYNVPIEMKLTMITTLLEAAKLSGFFLDEKDWNDILHGWQNP